MYKQVILYDNTGTLLLLLKNTAQYKVQKYKKMKSKKYKIYTAQHDFSKVRTNVLNCTNTLTYRILTEQRSSLKS